MKKSGSKKRNGLGWGVYLNSFAWVHIAGLLDAVLSRQICYPKVWAGCPTVDDDVRQG